MLLLDFAIFDELCTRSRHYLDGVLHLWILSKKFISASSTEEI